MAAAPLEFSLYDTTESVSEDLSLCQFHAVKPGTTKNSCLLAGAGALAIGILQNKPCVTTGIERDATVRRLGRSLAVSDGSGTPIAIGDWLKSDASGHLVKVSANNDYAFARAEQPSTAAGTIIEVTLTGGMYYGA